MEYYRNNIHTKFKTSNHFFNDLGYARTNLTQFFIIQLMKYVNLAFSQYLAII